MPTLTRIDSAVVKFESAVNKAIREYPNLRANEVSRQVPTPNSPCSNSYFSILGTGTAYGFISVVVTPQGIVVDYWVVDAGMIIKSWPKKANLTMGKIGVAVREALKDISDTII